jgi:hypothetical protein
MYCSDELDMLSDFATILSTLLCLRLTIDEKLGMSRLVKHDEAGRSYIEVDLETVATPQASSYKSKLFLDDEPIAMSRRQFGESMACYRARLTGSAESRGLEHIVKFNWEVWWRHREPKLLQLAKKKNVWGIVSLDFYQEGEETTADLRAGLRFGPLRTLRESGLSTAAAAAVPNTTSRGNSILAHTEETRQRFRKLLLSCAVLSPVGRPLHTFKTRLELLQVFRDAIKAHRSLLQDGGILHRDISAGNIVIVTDAATGEDSPKAILIDLDLARDLEAEEDDEDDDLGAMGTKAFMAIDILREPGVVAKTYRHDLESFFYVFLWTVVAGGARDPPSGSRLRRWGEATWREGAEVKTADVGEGERFRGILGEFPAVLSCLKPLAETMRRVLFRPDGKEGNIWTGTPAESRMADEMYDGLIGAFEGAIAAFDGEEEGAAAVT